MNPSLLFYSQHSQYTDPGIYAYLLQDFSEDIPQMVKQVQNLFMHHHDHAEMARYHELDLRYVSKMIAQLQVYDERPLTEVRRLTHRIMGVCRDTALMACAILRDRGIPARLRVGYISYFIPNYFLDGVCLEYWCGLQKRWLRVDTRTTDAIKEKLSIEANLFDLQTSDFFCAGQAWLAVMCGKYQAQQFGSRKYNGLWYMRNRLIHDFAALNKQEMLIWDVWGDMCQEKNGCPVYTQDEEIYLTQLAKMIAGSQHDLSDVRACYQYHSRWKVPKKIECYNPFLTKYDVAL